MTEEEIRRLQDEHWARPASEYHQAGKHHAMPAVPVPEPEKAHSLMFEALQSPVRLPEGAFSLDKSPLKRMGRGRPVTRSRYDDFIEALKSAIQRQARLPRLRVGAKKQGCSVETAAREIAGIVSKMPAKERVTASKVWSKFDDRRAQRLYRGPMVSEWTVQKILADLRRKGIIPR